MSHNPVETNKTLITEWMPLSAKLDLIKGNSKLKIVSYYIKDDKEQQFLTLCYKVANIPKYWKQWYDFYLNSDDKIIAMYEFANELQLEYAETN